MAINKEMFTTYFQYKDYYKCIDILRKEIINILTKKVQEKHPEYKYTTISSLKQVAFKYLTRPEQEIAIQLYDYSFNEHTSEYELSQMMEIYQELSK